MQYSQGWVNFCSIFRVKYELGKWFIKKNVDKYGRRVQLWQFKLSWGSCNIKAIECLYFTKISQVPAPPSCRWMGDPGSGPQAQCCAHNPGSQLEAHAHHHTSLLVQKNGKERFPAYKEPGNVQLGRGVKLKPWTQVMGSAAKEETVHGGGTAGIYRFDPLSKHLFVKFTNSHESGGTSFVQVCTSALTALYRPPLTQGCPSTGTKIKKISPQVCPCTFAPVKVPRWRNSEQSRQARGKCVPKYLLQGAGFSAEQDIMKS